MRIALLAILLSASAANAESFLHLAATDDGGAWVLVDRSEHGERRVELRRIDRDGHGAAETSGRDEPVEAIAVAHDDLWAVTERAVLRRDRSGWHALEVPVSRAQGSYAIVPLDHDRAIVARACPGHTPAAQSVPLPCSELFVVAVDAQRVEPALEVEGRVDSAATGGWLVIARSTRNIDDARRVVAHFAGDTWTAWTQDGEPLAGMRDGGKLPFEPSTIAATPDGVIGAGHTKIYRLGDDGPGPSLRVDGGGDHRWDVTIAIVTHDRAFAAVTSPRTFPGDDDDDDCTPTVRTPDHSEDVPTPHWWRHGQWCPLVEEAAEAGGHLWILSSEAIFHRDGGHWHTIEAAGDHEHALPVRVAISVPLQFGYAHTDRSGFAIGLRPELVVSRDVAHPRFAIGPFAELARGAGDTYVGGGVTAVHYGPRLGVAGSLGYDGVYAGSDWHGQLVASAFVGIRRHVDRDLPIDAPFGLRFDVRPRTDDLPTAVTASLSFDTASLGVAIAMLAGHARGD